jgi:hypothetical protein
VQLEALDQLENPVTSSGIETATFRLVAQYLNQLGYRVPLIHLLRIQIATVPSRYLRSTLLGSTVKSVMRWHTVRDGGQAVHCAPTVEFEFQSL